MWNFDIVSTKSIVRVWMKIDEKRIDCKPSKDFCFLVRFTLHFEQCFKKCLKRSVKSQIYYEQIFLSYVQSNSKWFLLCIMCSMSFTKEADIHILLSIKELTLSLIFLRYIKSSLVLTIKMLILFFSFESIILTILFQIEFKMYLCNNRFLKSKIIFVIDATNNTSSSSFKFWLDVELLKESEVIQTSIDGWLDDGINIEVKPLWTIYVGSL